MSEEIGSYQREVSIKNKLISELSKKVSVDESDRLKDKVAERIISELDLFLQKLKTDKKTTLEISIKHELNRLMHKKEFVSKVQVDILNEIIDIKLFEFILSKQTGNPEDPGFAKGMSRQCARLIFVPVISQE